MKKLFVGLFVFGLLVASCNKENIPVKIKKEQTSDLSWRVKAADIEEELNAIFISNSGEWGKVGVEKTSSLKIVIKKDGFAYFDFYENQSLYNEKKIVCKGSGYSFASCVKDWLKANEKKCLRIWVDGETYYASDNCSS